MTSINNYGAQVNDATCLPDILSALEPPDSCNEPAIEQNAGNHGGFTGIEAPDNPMPDETTPTQKVLDYELAECSQTGVARVFAQNHGDVVRYVKAKDAFMVWNGQRWELGDKAQDELDFFAETLRGIIDHYPAQWEEPGKGRPKLVFPEEHKFAVGQLKLERNISAISKAARRIESLRENMLRFDNRPNLLLFQNGVVNLETGRLYEKPDKGLYLTQMVPLIYDPNLRSKLWANTLMDIFDNDEGLITYLQEVFGYGVTGCTDEECFWMFVGATRAGKGTILNTITTLLGLELADTISRKSIMRSGDRNKRADLAVIWNKRLLRCSELEQEDILAATVKSMTGGDPVTAEFKFGNPFSYLPKYKLFVDTNEKPKVADHYTFSRIRLIEFPKSFLGAEALDLKRRLSSPEELQRIVPWIIKGAIRWYSRGRLQTPKKVIDALAEYKLQDPMYRFAKTKCEKIDYDGTAATRLEREAASCAYEQFLISENLYQGPINPTAFGRQFVKHFPKRKRIPVDGGKKTFYLGVRLPPIGLGDDCAEPTEAKPTLPF